jgi:hypothetical protein
MFIRLKNMRLISAVAAILILVTLVADGQTPSPSPTPGRGAIAGRVLDGFGDPVVRARVLVEVRTGPNATRTVAATEADDRGEYRIGRLSNGSYLVSVLQIDAFLITPTAFVMSSPTRAPTKTYYRAHSAARRIVIEPTGALV